MEVIDKALITISVYIIVRIFVLLITYGINKLLNVRVSGMSNEVVIVMSLLITALFLFY